LNREKVDRYLKQLLSVTISAEQSETEDSPLLNTIICVSIEAIKEIYEVACKNREILHLQHLSFDKYLSRIQEFVKSEEGQKIFKPSKELFALISEDTKEKLPENSKQTVKRSEAHYLKFHDYRPLKDNDPIKLSETWQELFYELFKHLNLKEYYMMIIHSGKQIESFLLNEILSNVQEVPDVFWIAQENQDRVNFLIDTFTSTVESKGEVSYEEIMDFIDLHTKKISQIKERENIVMKLLGGMMRTAETYHRKTKAASELITMEIIPLLIAGYILNSKNNFPFYIEKLDATEVEKVLEKKEAENLFTESNFFRYSHNKRPDFILKLNTGTGKPKMNMKSIFAPKATTIKKKNIVFKAESIKDFIKYFQEMKIKNKIIAECDNSTGELYIYSDFVKALFKTINEHPLSSEYTKEQKQNIVIYIERYVLFKIYKQ